ncbi:MAG: GntR family transcriptional regulator [Acidimicrobiaceae bacterium]|nr:GntR family transcriptional regulator [Acidimicrobiaceae bacterium]
MRSARYREIADDLRHRLAAGEFSAGRLLPSEAELGAAYAASRVTVRKALEGLREEGLLASRQGIGWQPAFDPLRQTLGRLGTIEAQLADAGIASTRQILDFGFVNAPARVRRVLDSRRVLEVRRLNLANGEPFARVTVWCAEQVGRQLSLQDVERSSFYELLDVELGGATQTIGAAGATKSDAELLRLVAGSPVLRCTRVTNDVAGRAVLMSEHVFPADRTEFVVDLTHVERSIAPNGLRLVE